MHREKIFSIAGIMFLVIIIFMISVDLMAAAGEVQSAPAVNGADHNRIFLAMTAMGSVGISCITSAYALARIGTAAMGAMSEKPEIGGRALIFLGMAEGIAIYGLIIAIMILNKIQ